MKGKQVEVIVHETSTFDQEGGKVIHSEDRHSIKPGAGNISVKAQTDL